ncbi:hypothetical protein COJ51_20970, partial [Bacillus thuringiensis]
MLFLFPLSSFLFFAYHIKTSYHKMYYFMKIMLGGKYM